MRLLGDDRVTGVVLQRQRLGEFDNSGRRRPVPVDGDEVTLDVDVLIPAIGQTTDLSWMNEDGIEATRSSTFVVKDAFNTTRPGVFAAGDAVSGPATVIQAVAQGNLVAVAVDQWLQTGEMVKPRLRDGRALTSCSCTNLDDYANARRPEAAGIAGRPSAAATSAKSSLGSTRPRCARKPNAACAATSNGWTSWALPGPSLRLLKRDSEERGGQ